MGRGWVLALVAALVLAVLAGGGPLPSTPAAAQTPVSHLRPDGRIALAWFYGGSTADYMAQIDRAQGLSVVSPTWWYLDTDQPGQLELDTDDALTAYAHERGIAVWPLFGNHIDPDVTDQVLRDPALRQQVVDGIVAEVRRSGVDGVNVDFENLHDDTRFLLTDLVAELKAALPDLVISVDVTAQTDTWVLGNWSTAFDREGLGRVADYVMLMAYDQHNSLRRDGPVAGLQWVIESTEFLLRTVPAEKVVLGLPFYSRDWAEDASATDGIDLDATLGMAAMGQRMAERSQGVTYDPVAGQDLHTYVDAEGRPHRVWLEDVASLQRKTELVATHGLAGIAAWRAGFEQPEVWTALDAQLAVMPAGAPATPAPEPAAQPVPEESASAAPLEGAAGAAGASPSAEAVPSPSDQLVTPADPTATPSATPSGQDAAAGLPDRGGWLVTAVVLLALVGIAASVVLRRRRGPY